MASNTMLAVPAKRYESADIVRPLVDWISGNYPGDVAQKAKGDDVNSGGL
jgi:hypothetical protein